MAAICETLGRHEEAVHHWKEAIAANPRFAPSAYALFQASMSRCDFRGADEAAEGLLAAGGPGPEWAQMRAAIADAKGLDVDAELIAMMNRFPMSTAAGMLLARRMLARGQEWEVQPLLRRLDDWGCPEAAFYEGVFAARRAQFGDALYYTRRCLDLDPENEQAKQQLEGLQRAIDAESSDESSEEGPNPYVV